MVKFWQLIISAGKKKKFFNHRTAISPHLKKPSAGDTPGLPEASTCRESPLGTHGRRDLPGPWGLGPRTAGSVRTKRTVALGSLLPWASNPQPRGTEPAPSSDPGPGRPGTQVPANEVLPELCPRLQGCGAAGGGGRRRGLLERPGELPPAVLVTFSLTASAPRTSSSCTSGVRERLKRHHARDGAKSGSGRGVVAGQVPAARGGLGESPGR